MTTWWRVLLPPAGPDSPLECLIELDDGLWEIRKIEIFPDGREQYADADTTLVS